MPPRRLLLVHALIVVVAIVGLGLNLPMFFFVWVDLPQSGIFDDGAAWPPPVHRPPARDYYIITTAPDGPAAITT